MFEIDAFLVGLLFGSLLNVCIARLPLHESIVRPRSHCPRCDAMIHWYDNIPILSFILLRAKCRKCKARIPWRYPLVELAVGLWFASGVFTGLRRRHSDPTAFLVNGTTALTWATPF